MSGPSASAGYGFYDGGFGGAPRLPTDSSATLHPSAAQKEEDQRLREHAQAVLADFAALQRELSAHEQAITQATREGDTLLQEAGRHRQAAAVHRHRFTQREAELRAELQRLSALAEAQQQRLGTVARSNRSQLQEALAARDAELSSATRARAEHDLAASTLDVALHTVPERAEGRIQVLASRVAEISTSVQSRTKELHDCERKADELRRRAERAEQELARTRAAAESAVREAEQRAAEAQAARDKLRLSHERDSQWMVQQVESQGSAYREYVQRLEAPGAALLGERALRAATAAHSARAAALQQQCAIMQNRLDVATRELELRRQQDHARLQGEEQQWQGRQQQRAEGRAGQRPGPLTLHVSTRHQPADAGSPKRAQSPLLLGSPVVTFAAFADKPVAAEGGTQTSPPGSPYGRSGRLGSYLPAPPSSPHLVTAQPSQSFAATLGTAQQSQSFAATLATAQPSQSFAPTQVTPQPSQSFAVPQGQPSHRPPPSPLGTASPEQLAASTKVPAAPFPSMHMPCGNTISGLGASTAALSAPASVTEGSLAERESVQMPTVAQRRNGAPGGAPAAGAGGGLVPFVLPQKEDPVFVGKADGQHISPRRLRLVGSQPGSVGGEGLPFQSSELTAWDSVDSAVREQIRRDLLFAVECSPAAEAAAREALALMGAPADVVPAVPPRVQDAPDTRGASEVLLSKGPGERMGCTWANATLVLAAVVPGSAADRSGLQRFVGWRVTHMNGAGLHSVQQIAQLAQGATAILMRFEPPASFLG